MTDRVCTVNAAIGIVVYVVITRGSKFSAFRSRRVIGSGVLPVAVGVAAWVRSIYPTITIVINTVGALID